MKGFSSKTLATRLKELKRNGILDRQAGIQRDPTEGGIHIDVQGTGISRVHF
jgi:hypothetical protein